MKTFEQRFWEKVNKNGPTMPHMDTPCWMWTAFRLTWNGYGAFKVGGKKGKAVKAHRLVWELTYGPIPEGMKVLHKCDNPACCNPDHLFLGTPLDNATDRDSKGRGVLPRVRGEQHWNRKLTEAQVLEVPELYKSGLLQREIAARLGVSAATISSILCKKHWTWLNQE